MNDQQRYGRSHLCEHCGRSISGALVCASCRWRLKRYGDSAVGVHARKREPEEYFFAHVFDVSDECVEWPFGKCGGYGVLAGGRRAHILACELWHGARPQRLEAAHSCGNPSCFNGAHLRWATKAENAADRYVHGTARFGELCAQSLLSWADVSDIRAAAQAGESYAAIAARYPVSASQVGRIVRGKAWAQVTA